MTEVLEQKIEDLTEYIKNLDVSSRADDETYKSILAKIERLSPILMQLMVLFAIIIKLKVVPLK